MTALHGAAPQTAGMLRIQKGQDERHVWPVHLSGWLALGWRVAGGKEPVAMGDFGAEQEQSASSLDAALEREHDRVANEKAASTRGRRGRKSRDELSQDASADVAPIPQQEAPSAEETPLSALPEGLLDDPLI